MNRIAQNTVICALAGVGAITIAYQIYERSTRFLTKITSTGSDHAPSRLPHSRNFENGSQLASSSYVTSQEERQEYMIPYGVSFYENDDTASRVAQLSPMLAQGNCLGLSDDGHANIIEESAPRHEYTDLPIVSPISANIQQWQTMAVAGPSMHHMDPIAHHTVYPSHSSYVQHQPVIPNPHAFIQNNAPQYPLRLARMHSRVPAQHVIHDSTFDYTNTNESSSTTNYEHTAASHSHSNFNEYPTVRNDNQSNLISLYNGEGSSGPLDHDSSLEFSLSPRIDVLYHDYYSNASIVISSSSPGPRVLEYRTPFKPNLSSLSIKLEPSNWGPGVGCASIEHVLRLVPNPSHLREIKLEVDRWPGQDFCATRYHTMLKDFYRNLTRLTLKGNVISADDCITILSQCPNIIEFEIDSVQHVDSAMRRAYMFPPDMQLALPYLKSLSISSFVNMGTLCRQLDFSAVESVSITLGMEASRAFTPSDINLRWGDLASVVIEGNITHNAREMISARCGCTVFYVAA